MHTECSGFFLLPLRAARLLLRILRATSRMFDSVFFLSSVNVYRIGWKSDQVRSSSSKLRLMRMLCCKSGFFVPDKFKTVNKSPWLALGSFTQRITASVRSSFNVKFFVMSITLLSITLLIGPCCPFRPGFRMSSTKTRNLTGPLCSAGLVRFNVSSACWSVSSLGMLGSNFNRILWEVWKRRSIGLSGR